MGVCTLVKMATAYHNEALRRQRILDRAFEAKRRLNEVRDFYQPLDLLDQITNLQPVKTQHHDFFLFLYLTPFKLY